MDAKVSIGGVQPHALKWMSFLFTAGFGGLVSVFFCWSAKPGYGVILAIIAIALIALVVAHTGFYTLYTANVYVSGSQFIIEHAIWGTLVKASALYSHVDDTLFYYCVVFRDGTKYYFIPSFTGFWQAFIKDSQGYSNYVRDLVQTQLTASDSPQQAIQQCPR